MVRLLATLIGVLTLGAVLDAHAAVEKGLVLADELGGQPVAGAEIVTAEGSVGAVTDAAGAFTLSFPDKQAGDNVKLSVRKEGYEVVNDVQLEHSLAQEGEEGALVLLLCKEGSRKEMLRRMLLLSAVKAMEASYLQGLKELKKQGENELAGLSDLQRRRHQAEDTLTTIPKELMKTSSDSTSERRRQAIRLFLEGELGKAIGMLEKREAVPSREDATEIAPEGAKSS
ncbi:MAG TPA: hypothetical protein DCZ69_14005, partial [Syntrophobacteraceae bacterium]|nr:hypothetical protein [Syntrophobacteraceae bacterium]